MKKMNSPEVVVIGGGVIGSAVTYYLSKAGVTVALLEKDDLVSGTSGACNGFVWLGTKKPGLHLRLARESLEMFRGLIEELSRDVEYHSTGEMLIIETEQELNIMQDFVAGQRSAGVDIRLLTSGEAKEMQPALAETKIVGATYSPLGMLIHPMNLTLGLIEDAEKMGAHISLLTQVENITIGSGRVRSVRTNREEIKAKFVVNAAGISAPVIGRMVGLEVPITPLKGQLMVTESVPPLIRVPTIESRYLAVKRNPELLKKTTRSGVTFSTWQDADGKVYLGSSKEFVGDNRKTTIDAMTTLAKKAINFYPGLSNLHVIRAYAGLRPYTSDGLPIVGKVQGLEGFIMAAGHGGDGVSLAPITGKLVYDLIVHGEPSIPIEELALSRFN